MTHKEILKCTYYHELQIINCEKKSENVSIFIKNIFSKRKVNLVDILSEGELHTIVFKNVRKNEPKIKEKFRYLLKSSVIWVVEMWKFALDSNSSQMGSCWVVSVAKT